MTDNKMLVIKYLNYYTFPDVTKKLDRNWNASRENKSLDFACPLALHFGVFPMTNENIVIAWVKKVVTHKVNLPLVEWCVSFRMTSVENQKEAGSSSSAPAANVNFVDHLMTDWSSDGKRKLVAYS